MYNHELLNKMIDRFDMEKVVDFAEMVSFMHDVLYKEALAKGPDDFTEHSFERDWWQNKFEELKSVTA